MFSGKLYPVMVDEIVFPLVHIHQQQPTGQLARDQRLGGGAGGLAKRNNKQSICGWRQKNSNKFWWVGDAADKEGISILHKIF